MTDTQLTIGWIIYFLIGSSISYLMHYLNGESYVFEWAFMVLFWPIAMVGSILSIKVINR